MDTEMDKDLELFQTYNIDLQSKDESRAIIGDIDVIKTPMWEICPRHYIPRSQSNDIVLKEIREPRANFLQKAYTFLESYFIVMEDSEDGPNPWDYEELLIMEFKEEAENFFKNGKK